MNEVHTEFSGEIGHKIEASDMLLAKDASRVLNKHYPGHLWAVHVNSEGGVMNIKNFSISFKYGMVLHLKNVYGDPSLKRVIRSAGELLERAALARGKSKGDKASYVEGLKPQHQPVAGIIQ